MKLVYGVGINDADYEVAKKENGKQAMCPAYRCWKDMMMRAYCPHYHARQPTYRSVTVCEEWHRFSNFKRWYDEHYVEGWQLDKDLLTAAREYGAGVCLFVPRWMNCFTIDCAARRGDLPIGVSEHRASGRLQVHCSNPVMKTREYLGLFSSPEEAHRAWLDRKIELAYQLKDWMDAIDRRIYFRVIEIIFRAK